MSCRARPAYTLIGPDPTITAVWRCAKNLGHGTFGTWDLAAHITHIEDGPTYLADRDGDGKAEFHNGDDVLGDLDGDGLLDAAAINATASGISRVKNFALTCDHSLDSTKENMLNGDEPMKNRTNAGDHCSTVSSRRRLASATLFATTLAMCMVLIGCAATDEYVEAPSHLSEHSQPSHRVLQPNIVTALQSCMNEGVSRLSRHAYDLSFEVEVNAARAIRGITPQGKRLDDAKIETCIIKVLDTMPMRDLFPLDDAEPVTSQNNSRPGRNLLGTTSVLPQVIRFVPIVIAAPGGITIVVTVVVVVAVATVATMSAECEKQWDDARDYCDKLLRTRNPSPHLTGGYTDVENCARGHVDELCKGNPVDWGNQGRPGRRY